VFECNETANKFFVPHEQLPASVESTISDLQNPAPRLFRRRSPPGDGFFSKIDEIGGVEVQLDDIQHSLAAISGIGASACCVECLAYRA
jgi:hypothetical protein